MELASIDFVENCVCDEVSSEEAIDIVKNKYESIIELIKQNEGSGLAGPQVGDLKKYFVMLTGDKEYKIFFNPRYVMNGSRIQTQEACLTYGNDKFTKCKRFKSVVAFYDDLIDGKLVSQRVKVKGIDAIIFQHETDHCYGKTIFMR